MNKALKLLAANACSTLPYIKDEVGTPSIPSTAAPLPRSGQKLLILQDQNINPVFVAVLVALLW